VTGRETAGLSAKGQPIDADAGLPQLVEAVAQTIAGLDFLCGCHKVTILG
jgi:hypothetical protein